MYQVKLFMIFSTVIGVIHAAQPIASITSASSFELRGHIVNVDGVPTWPLTAGDQITAGKEAATIELRDGSRVFLQKDSQLRLDSKNDTVLLHLMSGSLRMGSVVSPRVAVYASGNLVKPAGGSVVTAGSASHVPSRAQPALNLPHPVSHR